MTMPMTATPLKCKISKILIRILIGIKRNNHKLAYSDRLFESLIFINNIDG